MDSKKWCLLKASDGARGAAGKQKVYEVRIEDTVVVCEWGMAEKAQRQRSVNAFGSAQAALRFAYDKVYAKVDKGYRVAYSV
jgi:predicted DNA-binding WGR domain protein